MSNASTSKLGESNRHHIFINRLISFYTFVGITYLLFFKSNQQCNCASFNNKLLSTHTILTTEPNITTTITDIPTLYRTPLHGSKRNLLSSNTTIQSVKRNHELIQNLYSMLPNGVVLLWYGSISTIPPGWSLCDGTNDTPDLRDKFVIGGGNLYNLNDNGGSSDIQLSINDLPTHSHDMSNILSTTHTGHTHNTGTFSFSNQNGHTHTFSDTSTSSGSHIHSCSASTANSGTHSHPCSTSTTSSGDHSHSCSAATISSGDHSHSCSASTVSTGGHRHNNGEYGYLVRQRSDGCGTVGGTDCIGEAGSFDLEYSGWMTFTGDHSHDATCSTGSNGIHSHGATCSTGTDGTHSHTTNCNTGSVSNHNHGASCNTVSAGSHNHSISGTTSSSTTHSHTISGLSGNDGGHSHSVSGTTNSIGNSNTINILNPYYTAYYIMKIPYKFATDSPTNAPTIAPSTPPTKNPSQNPTIAPSKSPSKTPTQSPSKTPTLTPTLTPTKNPSKTPTKNPSKTPTQFPSVTPTLTPTIKPSPSPANVPTASVTISPTLKPSLIPTVTPTSSPSNDPSIAPTLAPSLVPSITPTTAPSNVPSIAPSITPTTSPSITPTTAPSISPSIAPSIVPTLAPSLIPTLNPTITPSNSPSKTPSSSPTSIPSISPSIAPTLTPTLSPTITPTSPPSNAPSVTPTIVPSVVPSIAPTLSPSVTTTFAPSLAPTICWDAKYKWCMISSINSNRNDMLFSGESLVSANCNYILTMKANGNLVLNGVVGNDENKTRIYTGWETNTTIKNNSDESISVAKLKDGTLLVEEHQFYGVPQFDPIELWKSDEYIMDENELILQLSDGGCLSLSKYSGSTNTDHLIPIWFVCAQLENDKNDNIDISTTIGTTSMVTIGISKNANDNDDDILGIVLNIDNNDDKIKLLTIWNIIITFLLIIILFACLYICIKRFQNNYKVTDPQGLHTAVSRTIMNNEEEDAELQKIVELWSMETDNVINTEQHMNNTEWSIETQNTHNVPIDQLSSIGQIIGHE